MRLGERQTRPAHGRTRREMGGRRVEQGEKKGACPRKGQQRRRRQQQQRGGKVMRKAAVKYAQIPKEKKEKWKRQKHDMRTSGNDKNSADGTRTERIESRRERW